MKEDDWTPWQGLDPNPQPSGLWPEGLLPTDWVEVWTRGSVVTFFAETRNIRWRHIGSSTDVVKFRRANLDDVKAKEPGVTLTKEQAQALFFFLRSGENLPSYVGNVVVASAGVYGITSQKACQTRVDNLMDAITVLTKAMPS